MTCSTRMRCEECRLRAASCAAMTLAGSDVWRLRGLGLGVIGSAGFGAQSLVAGVGENLDLERRGQEEVDEPGGPGLGEVVHRARTGLAAEQQPADRVADHEGGWPANGERFLRIREQAGPSTGQNVASSGVKPGHSGPR